MNETTSSPSTIQDEKFASAALIWFEQMQQSNEWDLSIEDQALLLGCSDISTLNKWFADAGNAHPIMINDDMLTRLGLLLNIYKSFISIVPQNNPAIASEWFIKKNTNLLFNGMSPKEFLLSSPSIDTMLKLQGYLSY